MRRRLALALTIGATLLAVPLIAEPRVEVLSQVDWSVDLNDFCNDAVSKTARCIGAFKDRESGTRFGGLSGLEIDDGGHEFLTISDTGVAYFGVFERVADGAITDVMLLQARELLFEGGQRPEKKKDRDTEGLASLAPEQLYISAESKARLLRYDDNNPQPTFAPLPLAGARTPLNMGFEALAIDATGALFALPEGSANIRAPFDLFKRRANGDWSVIYQLPRHGGFRPVGADFGKDGHLYVLSRAFNGFAFASQIQRILFKDGTPSAHQMLFTSPFGQFDNLEGLATWQAGPDDLRLYAVSDDNFSGAQSTIIVEFQVHE